MKASEQPRNWDLGQKQVRKSEMDNILLSSYMPLIEKHLLSAHMHISQLSK